MAQLSFRSFHCQRLLPIHFLIDRAITLFNLQYIFSNLFSGCKVFLRKSCDCFSAHPPKNLVNSPHFLATDVKIVWV